MLGVIEAGLVNGTSRIGASSYPRSDVLES